MVNKGKTEKVVVEKGFPMPFRDSNKSYPWTDMAVGDSFITKSKNPHTSAMWATKNFASSGLKFVARKMSDGKFRIWRTE